MKSRFVAIAFVVIMTVVNASGAEPSPSPAAKKTEKKAEKTDKKADERASASPSSLNKFLGDSKTPGSNEPTTTEIFSDEAFFDSNKSMGIFSGHVKVIDPRFNLQSDKLTVFISKSAKAGEASSTEQQASPSPGEQTGQGQGLEKAIAEGHVGVVRDRPDPNGGPPTRAVGRSDIATYVAATGDVELRGNPRVQQGENTHIATTPETVMVINQNGQLTTHGPSRTDIRQQPKEDKDNGEAASSATPDAKAKGSPKPDGKAKNKGEKPKPSAKP